MNVIFYNVLKRVNSTRQPNTAGTSYTCTLKDGSNIITPSITLKWSGSGAPSYNYAYIADFSSRYYWVTDWRFEDRCWTAYLKVDTLASFKTDIGLSTRYVLRCASFEDKTITENKYPATGSISSVTTYTGSATGWAEYGVTNGVYVVTVIGKGNSNNTNNVTQYQMSGSSVQTLIDNAMDAFVGSYNTLTANSPEEAIMNLIRLPMRFTSDLSQYIKSVMWFPFSFTSGASSDLYLGLFKSLIMANEVTTPLKVTGSTINVSAFPPANSRLWEYMSPYATYTLTFNPFGMIDLDPMDVIWADSIGCYVRVDSMSGLGLLEIVAQKGYDSKLLAQRTAQVGVQVPYGGTAPNYAGAIGGAANIVMAAASDSSMKGTMIAGAIGSAISNTNYQGYSSGTSGGGCSIDGNPPTLEVKVMGHVDMYPAEIGYPYCKTMMLNTASGFIQVADGEVRLANATRAELDEVKAYLEGGFFYE